MDKFNAMGLSLFIFIVLIVVQGQNHVDASNGNDLIDCTEEACINDCRTKMCGKATCSTGKCLALPPQREPTCVCFP